LLDILPRLYGEVWIPPAVRAEYLAGLRPGEPNPAGLPWLVVKEAPPDPTLPRFLGAGEAAALSLALSTRARVVLLDERLGRGVALARGLPVVGTLAVLLRAKQHDLLPAVRPAVETMIAQGRRISPSLVAQVLRAAGEDQ